MILADCNLLAGKASKGCYALLSLPHISTGRGFYNRAYWRVNIEYYPYHIFLDTRRYTCYTGYQ
jgi:hypothetical protein